MLEMPLLRRAKRAPHHQLAPSTKRLPERHATMSRIAHTANMAVSSLKLLGLRNVKTKWRSSAVPEVPKTQAASSSTDSGAVDQIAQANQSATTRNGWCLTRGVAGDAGRRWPCPAWRLSRFRRMIDAARCRAVAKWNCDSTSIPTRSQSGRSAWSQ